MIFYDQDHGRRRRGRGGVTVLGIRLTTHNRPPLGKKTSAS
jgi:hypothetical protein